MSDQPKVDWSAVLKGAPEGVTHVRVNGNLWYARSPAGELRIYNSENEEWERSVYCGDVARQQSMQLIPVPADAQQVEPVGNPEWPTEERINNIGPNGNEGEHYDALKASPAQTAVSGFWTEAPADATHFCLTSGHWYQRKDDRLLYQERFNGKYGWHSSARSPGDLNDMIPRPESEAQALLPGYWFHISAEERHKRIIARARGLRSADPGAAQILLRAIVDELGIRKLVEVPLDIFTQTKVMIALIRGTGAPVTWCHIEEEAREQIRLSNITHLNFSGDTVTEDALSKTFTKLGEALKARAQRKGLITGGYTGMPADSIDVVLTDLKFAPDYGEHPQFVGRLDRKAFPADGYERLHDVYRDAHDHAAYDKGKERHANDLPFHEQRMQTISQGLNSPVGMAYQVIKKLQEGLQMEDAGARRRELLGALNYLAGIVIFLDDQEAGGDV